MIEFKIEYMELTSKEPREVIFRKDLWPAAFVVAGQGDSVYDFEKDWNSRFQAVEQRNWPSVHSYFTMPSGAKLLHGFRARDAVHTLAALLPSAEHELNTLEVEHAGAIAHAYRAKAYGGKRIAITQHHDPMNGSKEQFDALMELAQQMFERGALFRLVVTNANDSHSSFALPLSFSLAGASTDLRRIAALFPGRN